MLSIRYSDRLVVAVAFLAGVTPAALPPSQASAATSARSAPVSVNYPDVASAV
jgi:hypothetical protein